MNRTIQIANTKTQQRHTIETSATTLGELQDQLTLQGIDFSGMTFTEGISKTQLLSRESILPTNVMYKGRPTNNLVILLTNTAKEIASGATTRAEVYALIKKYNLQEEVKNRFGKNFTQVSTENLMMVVDPYINGEARTTETVPTPEVETEPETCQCEAEEKEETPETKKESTKEVNIPHPQSVRLFCAAIDYMVSSGSLFMDDLMAISIHALEEVKKMESMKLDDADIDDIIANM